MESNDAQISTIVDALLSTSCNDSCEQSREAARQALVSLGTRQTQIVLEYCTIFVREAQKDGVRLAPATEAIVEVVDRIAASHGGSLDGAAVQNLVAFAIGLFGSAESVVETASSVLRTLGGGVHMKPVLLQLLTNRQLSNPISTQDAAVLRCLGDLALCDPAGFHQLDGFNQALKQLLPLLKLARPDRRGAPVVSALGALAEAFQSIGDGPLCSQWTEVVQPLVLAWLPSRDDAARQAASAAVAEILLVLSNEGFEQVLPAGFAAVVRALSGRSHLTNTARCVSSMLQRMSSGLAGGFMDANTNCLLLSMFPPLCAPVPASEGQLGSSGSKLRTELLRCFELLAKVRPVFLIKFLLGKLEDPKAQSEHAGTLGVIRHLLAHVQSELDSHKEQFVRQVLLLAGQPVSLGVSREIAQLAIAFSSIKWLDKEACAVLVPRLLDHASQTSVMINNTLAKVRAADREAHKDALEQLRTMCDHILDLLVKSSDPAMEETIWDTFCPALLDNGKAGALGIMCKCMAQIGAKRAASKQPLALQESVQPLTLTVRLMLLLAVPAARNQLGSNVLAAMQVLAPCISPQVDQLWQSASKTLATHLSTNAAGVKQQFWEEQLLRLYSATVDVLVDQNNWSGEELADEIVAQTKGCNSSVLIPFRSAALKYLGVTLRKLASELVPPKLDSMFELADHSNPVEQDGLAQAIGFCASTHLPLLVTKVGAVMSQQEGQQKKSGGGLMSMFSSSKPAKPSPQPLQASVLLCIGWMAVYAPPEEVLGYVEQQLVNTVTPLLWDLKSPAMRIAALRAIELICKALIQKHPGQPGVLTQRDEILDHCLGLLCADVDDNQKRMLVAMHACTRLCLLEPCVSLEQTSRLLDASVPYFSLEGDSVKELLSASCDMMAAILHKNRTAECLETVLGALQEPLRTMSVLERQRATMTVHFLLIKFKEYCEESLSGDAGFEQFGACIGMLIPRVLDEESAIRALAVKAISTVLSVQSAHLGRPQEHTAIVQGIVEKLVLAGGQFPGEEAESDQIMSPAQELLSVAHVEQAAKQLCLLVQPSQVVSLVHSLVDSMSCQPQEFCTRAAACVFTLVVKHSADALADDVESTLEACLRSLELVEYHPTLTTAVGGVSHMTSCYLPQVLPVLLQQPLPHSPVIVSVLQASARSSGLQLLELLVDAVFTEDDFVPAKAAPDPEDPLPESQGEYQVMELSSCQRSAMAALRQCFVVDELAMEAAKPEYLPKLLSAAMLLISSTRHAQELGLISQEDGALTIDDSVEMSSILLRRNGSTTALEVIESLNDELLSGSISSAVMVFTDAIALYLQPRSLLSGCVECMLPLMAETAPEAHQLTAAVCLGSMLRHLHGVESANEAEKWYQARTVVSALLDRTSGSCETVRWITFQSLQGLTQIPPADIAPLLPQIVSNLGNALCGDEVPHITVIAASLLSQILVRRQDYGYTLPEGILYSFLSFGQEILERPEASERSSTAALVEVLSDQGVDIASKACKLLPGLLLHLDEEDSEVRDACGSALKQLCTHFPVAGVHQAVCEWHEAVADGSGGSEELEGLFRRLAVLLAAKESDESLARPTLDSCARMLGSMASSTRSSAARFGTALASALTASQAEMVGGQSFMQEVLHMLKNDEDDCVRAKIARCLGNVSRG